MGAPSSPRGRPAGGAPQPQMGRRPCSSRFFMLRSYRSLVPSAYYGMDSSQYTNCVLSTQDLCTETWPLRAAASSSLAALSHCPERPAAAPAPQLAMSLCARILFVAMVASLGASATQDAASRQAAQPAQPAQAQDSTYSLLVAKTSTTTLKAQVPAPRAVTPQPGLPFSPNVASISVRAGWALVGLGG
jgi:hypothetical protein